MTNGRSDESADPFEGLVLDEDFILAARKREPSADDRLSRAATLRSNLERQKASNRAQARLHRRAAGRTRRGITSPGRRVGRRPRRNAAAIVVVALVVGLVWWELDHRDAVSWQGGDPMMQLLDQQHRPTPAAPESNIPLGTPDPRPAGGGPHEFIATQADRTTPVSYDPCRPISIVINTRTMPSAATGIVDEAIHEVSSITGLRLSIEGATDEPATEDRPAYQPDRYGDRWAPVLIAWTDPVEHPELAGNVAGLGGSYAVEVEDSTRVYVSGIVHLDGPDIEAILDRPDGRAMTKAIVLHELGHLLGLGHVDDPRQLMHAENTGLVTFDNGDLTGLHAVSRGACVDRL